MTATPPTAAMSRLERLATNGYVYLVAMPVLITTIGMTLTKNLSPLKLQQEHYASSQQAAVQLQDMQKRAAHQAFVPVLQTPDLNSRASAAVAFCLRVR